MGIFSALIQTLLYWVDLIMELMHSSMAKSHSNRVFFLPISHLFSFQYGTLFVLVQNGLDLSKLVWNSEIGSNSTISRGDLGGTHVRLFYLSLNSRSNKQTYLVPFLYEVFLNSTFEPLLSFLRFWIVYPQY